MGSTGRPPGHGRKPPPPVRTGPTRSTFDGCAVTAFFIVSAPFVLVYSIWELLT